MKLIKKQLSIRNYFRPLRAELEYNQLKNKNKNCTPNLKNQRQAKYILNLYQEFYVNTNATSVDNQTLLRSLIIYIILLSSSQQLWSPGDIIIIIQSLLLVQHLKRTTSLASRISHSPSTCILTFSLTNSNVSLTQFWLPLLHSCRSSLRLFSSSPAWAMTIPSCGRGLSQHLCSSELHPTHRGLPGSAPGHATCWADTWLTICLASLVLWLFSSHPPHHPLPCPTSLAVRTCTLISIYLLTLINISHKNIPFCKPGKKWNQRHV